MNRLTPAQTLALLQPQGKQKAKGSNSLRHIATFGDADDDLYVFGNSDGGVLVPSLEPIANPIGVWQEQGDTIPPALQDMLREYANEAEWYERVGEEIANKAPAKAKAKTAPRQSIPMMLTTKWNQKSPYNDTLVFNGKKCPTGCNATAAAQIMKHWFDKGFHRGCPPTDNYITSTNGYEIKALPAKVVFDYKNLVNTPKTAEQKAAVQELMEYIGKTFHSNYTPNGTGATPKNVAVYLKENLQMGSFITYITAAKLGLSSFENYIYNELLQGRPVMVAGWTGTGGGHSFVIDGYDVTQDMYHVNWGWGGSYDGWFKLTVLNATTSYAFNSRKAAIIGIQPEYKLGDINGDGEVNVTDAMQIIQNAQSGKYDPKSDINNDGQVTITDAQIIIDKVLGKVEL